MKLYTIGFTRKSAETFFTQLKQSGVRTLIDTRLSGTATGGQRRRAPRLGGGGLK